MIVSLDHSLCVGDHLLIWSDFWQSHELQHTRIPCPSPSLGVCSNSCPLSWWWLPTTSSSVVHYSSCLQSFPASGSFPESVICNRWPKDWSFRFIISASNEYSGLISFRIDWFVLLAVQGTFKILPSLLAQLVKNSPAMRETLVPFLGWEDLLEKW